MKYYIIAGEASGDLHAANLMKALKKTDANAEFRFWGGDLMQNVGGTLVKHYKEFIKKYSLTTDEIVYMGDDIPDVPVMKLVGLPCCPQDAAPEVKAISEYISHVNGGCGAARDIIEQVMKVRGLWMRDFDAQND